MDFGFAGVLVCSVALGMGIGLLKSKRQLKKSKKRMDFPCPEKTQKISDIKIVKDIDLDLISPRRSKRPLHLKDIAMIMSFIDDWKSNKSPTYQYSMSHFDVVKLPFKLVSSEKTLIRHLGREIYGLYDEKDIHKGVVFSVTNEGDVKLDGGYFYSLEIDNGFIVMESSEEKYLALITDNRMEVAGYIEEEPEEGKDK